MVLADGQVAVDTGVNAVQVISLAIGVFLPVLVGLVTKRVTSPGTRAILLALLSAVSGFGTEWLNSNGSSSYNWATALMTWIGTFVVAVSVHYGFWKPTGVSDKAKDSLVT